MEPLEHGVLLMMFVCFFFQEEDGIRYLVRSRGLGDVYKRQRLPQVGLREIAVIVRPAAANRGDAVVEQVVEVGLLPGKPLGRTNRLLLIERRGPVSYTHLTLPTSDLV